MIKGSDSVGENAPNAPVSVGAENSSSPAAEKGSLSFLDKLLLDSDEFINDNDFSKLEAERLEHLVDQVDDFGVEMVSRVVTLSDDAGMPVITFRYFLIATLLSLFAAFLGQIYYFKPQGLSISAFFLIIFSFFFGKLLAAILPKGILNPGAFNKKEHALIVITATTASIAPLASELIAAMELFYDTQLPAWLGFLIVLSSQFVGYGFAGFFREILVFPKETFYPTVLAQVSVYENLHNGDGLSKKMARYFFIVAGCVFCYEWLPQYMAPTLIGISIVCLSTKSLKSTVVTMLFGGSNAYEGLGLFSFCFDWNTLSGFTPMLLPWSTIVNLSIGVAVGIIALPLIWFNNVWNAQSYPFLGLGIYSPGGETYNQTAVLDSSNNVNFTAVEEVGLPGLTGSYIFYLVMSNMAITAGFTHIMLYHGKDVFTGIKNTFAKKGSSTNMDPYYLVMRKYKEVSVSVYIGLFILFAAIGLFVTVYSGSGLDWYLFILAIALSGALVLVDGFITATTGLGVLAGQLVQMIGGFIKPGAPVANMYFTLFGSNSCYQAVYMLTDLKTGQYMKLPPRATFFAQMYGAFIGAVTSYFVTTSIVSNNFDVLLSLYGNAQWNGGGVQNYNSNAITWGGFAQQMYGPGAPYSLVLYSFVIGFFIPIPAFVLHKYFPKVGFNLVNLAILAEFCGMMCTGIASLYFGTILIGCFTQFYMRRYHPNVFNKYQYITSAAFDAGNQWCALFVALIVGGAVGTAIPFPKWALNPDTTYGIYFSDYCYNAANDIGN
ncbi:hypothetical protein HDU84_009823 [Entophlyctis sp. JEL0112]|nr:hypothetical protein HDU84_009823 [Entophlyctis sp. JEL0112]